jgi:hypothetical protein
MFILYTRVASSSVGWSFALKAFWTLWDNIYDCVYYYNHCYGNDVKGFWTFWDNIYDYVYLHNKELHNLYSFPDIIRQIKSRPMKVERRKNCTRFWWESPKERDHSEDQGVGGRMGSEWILRRLAWGGGTEFDQLRTGTGGGLLWVRWWTLGFLRHGVS